MKRFIQSTHDIELINLLETDYELYHFTETVKDNMLYFDHQIKTGPLKTRNAVKILELMNFPAGITKEAGLLSERIFELSNKSHLSKWFNNQNQKDKALEK
ncbi:hypothetical protein ACFOG5_00300 [Pedobacter fastidiosus]|uniref:hypothetical protein n=1 Tax=Pedobacter fastidiosus TaxID=2765361 RepID=UPI00360D32DC